MAAEGVTITVAILLAMASGVSSIDHCWGGGQDGGPCAKTVNGGEVKVVACVACIVSHATAVLDEIKELGGLEEWPIPA